MVQRQEEKKQRRCEELQVKEGVEKEQMDDEKVEGEQVFVERWEGARVGVQEEGEEEVVDLR